MSLNVAYLKRNIYLHTYFIKEGKKLIYIFHLNDLSIDARRFGCVGGIGKYLIEFTVIILMQNKQGDRFLVAVLDTYVVLNLLYDKNIHAKLH